MYPVFVSRSAFQLLLTTLDLNLLRDGIGPVAPILGWVIELPVQTFDDCEPVDIIPY